MGKKYVKPVIRFESLALSSGVSSSCSFDILFAEFSCPILIPEWGETIYTQDSCDWSNDDLYVCYHVPTMSTNVFGS